MSSYAKHIGFVKIRKLNEDLNIDCIVDKVEIYSECIEKIKHFNLGTDQFFDSVSAIDIKYQYSYDVNDFTKLIDITNRYFKNLKNLSLINVQNLSLGEIASILINYKINTISFKPNRDTCKNEYSV